jgi:hypothetical protein
MHALMVLFFILYCLLPLPIVWAVPDSLPPEVRRGKGQVCVHSWPKRARGVLSFATFLGGGQDSIILGGEEGFQGSTCALLTVDCGICVYLQEARDLLGDYANQMRLRIPNITAIRTHRKQLEREHAFTLDYFEALSMSSELHLSRDQWRQVYPHLDPDKIIDPPTPSKLVRVSRRVQALAELLTDALEEEKFALMDAVYPFAKEVEAVFANTSAPDYKEKIAALQRRHTNYDLQSLIADGFVKRDSFRVSDDGNFVEFPKTGTRHLIQ